jgi:hypothetical protein
MKDIRTWLGKNVNFGDEIEFMIFLVWAVYSAAFFSSLIIIN